MARRPCGQSPPPWYVIFFNFNKNVRLSVYLTLKCTKDQSSHFCDCSLALNWIFHHHDHDLNTFRAGSAQPLVCCVINNSHYPDVKNNNPVYDVFGKHWMQARGLLNHRLKYCWLTLLSLVYVNTKVNVKSTTKVGGDNWGPVKYLVGHCSPRPPLESQLRRSLLLKLSNGVC